MSSGKGADVPGEDGQVLWAVGRRGGGPHQFHGAFAGDDRTAVVDLSGALPARDQWPAFQPGPLDATSGWSGHRVVVEFEVPDDVDPALRPEAYVLRLAFAASHGPCPDVLVELDGRSGLLRPRVRREDRTEVFRQSPIAGSVELAVALPGAWLAPGRHRLGLVTALDGAADGPPEQERRRAREQYGTWFGSGISWDSASLQAAPASALAPQVATTLAGTPLVVESGHGPRQLVDLCVDLVPGAPLDDVAVLEVGSERLELAVSSAGRAFGQVWVRTGVAEVEEPTAAALELAGTRTDHALRPPRHWTLHLVPHVHLDVGFTDHQGTVLELHSRNLDRAVAALEADPGFRLSVDGALVVGEHLATRRPVAAERMLTALRGGQMSVNAFHSLFLSGVASLEECYRATYLASALRDEHGVPVTYANLTDVPSYSAALPSVLTDLGIDAFVGIQNHGRAATSESDTAHLLSPFVWEGVDGARVLTHFADSYSQLRFLAADPQTTAGAAQGLERYLARYERPDYLPDDLPLIGTHSDNEDLADGDTGLVQRWNAAYRWPRLVVSTLAGYLETVRPLADRLPVWRGDGGSFWEDGVGTAGAAIAQYRRAQTLLPVAEGLALLVGEVSDAWRPNRQQLEAGWEGLLIGCEHTWTWSHASSHPHAHQSTDQLAWKEHRIATAWRSGTDEVHRAMSQLGELVTTDVPSLLVHNPLSWSRTVDVEVELAHGVRPSLDGSPVATELLADVDGLDRLRLTVPDVPAFGYRTLGLSAPALVEPGGPAAGTSPASSTDPSWEPVPERLETTSWQLLLDPSTGAVRQLVHRPTGRLLLDDDARWPLGSVLHVAHVARAPEDGNRSDSLQDRRPPAPQPELDVRETPLRAVGVRRTHDGWRIRSAGAGRTLPEVAVDVLVRDTTDVVEVHVSLEKEASLAKEAVYVAFPFAADDAHVRYDRQQGWVDPAVDHSPGACNEWFTTQHGVVVSSGVDGPAVAWSSAHVPLFAVGDVVRGRWPETFSTENGTLLSWVMNNYWPTNTPPSQSGSLQLRYAFAPQDRFDPAGAARLGRELRWPAVAEDVDWSDKFDTEVRPLPPTGSLVDLRLPDTVHATVAESRDRTATVLRLAELAGEEHELRVPHPSGRTGRAWLAWADDRPRETLDLDADGRLAVRLAPWSVVTLRLERADVAPVGS